MFNNIRTAVRERWQSFIRDLPFRMRIGRLGIWMVKVGRVLQERYANWNREFRLRTENYPPYGDDARVIHVSEPITDKNELTFGSASAQRDLQSEMVADLFRIQGIRRIYINPYKITLFFGGVFSWQELQPEIEAVILRHLTA